MKKITTSKVFNALRNLFALGFGLLIGGLVYVLLSVNLSSMFPLPEGVDTGNIESLRKYIEYFSYKNFIPPFLGHALGTLFGTLICTLIAKSRKAFLSLLIAAVFLGIGVFMVIQLPKTPLWFILIDLSLSYLPMATIGTILGRNIVKLANKK